LILIPETEWNSFEDTVDLKSKTIPVRLSCNSKREIWYSTGSSFTHIEDRDYIDIDEFPFFKRVLDFVLRHKKRGGQFFISAEMINIVKPDDEVARCKLSVISDEDFDDNGEESDDEDKDDE